MRILIIFHNVSKTYPNNEMGVENVSLEIKDGDFVFLVGQTGSGKSTLINLLTGELKPTTGDIIVNNLSLGSLNHKDFPYYRRLLGIINYDCLLIEHKTIYQNLEIPMLATGHSSKSIRESIPLALGLVGMSKKMYDYPSNLSGGETFKVLMARAVINNPKIIIADEPTAHLDYDSSLDIMSLFNEINQLGITIIIATHAKEFVDIMKKRVITMQNGKVLGDVSKGKYGWII
ncbi:cell division ATP-binding protein FtsE [Anaerotignum propionicum DSM 1682]|jgi:cell division transport system ATP-binding protein|uniref:Cell division ATP-binding protein FtsE n=1 Tax=Anaerotignum propionicum DSM 1682 TaxID=991789 RepID=A0ABN4LHL1_ANAPI|nr:ATP-binding cassette domain-containing protein [Anaerotignum propionicum]AMJ42368.1 cell division ATP-binding protein FtsE [Anaerotignum propionicum DSM 1682]